MLESCLILSQSGWLIVLRKINELSCTVPLSICLTPSFLQNLSSALSERFQRFTFFPIHWVRWGNIYQILHLGCFLHLSLYQSMPKVKFMLFFLYSISGRFGFLFNSSSNALIFFFFFSSSLEPGFLTGTSFTID